MVNRRMNRTTGFRSTLGLSAIGVILAFALPSAAHATKFANQFAEFEMPPQWNCNLEGAEWVCQSTDDKKRKDAIIVLAAKLKGDQDSLDQYLAYLKAPKSFTSVTGKPIKSEYRYAKTINLNGQAWVDALHMDSEIPGFYTRYLATVKQDIGVLVTYSINKQKYQTYLEDFENMVRTLKVFRKAGGINAAPVNSNLFQNTTIPQTMEQSTVFPGAPIQGGSDPAPARPSGGGLPMPLILVGVGAVAFILWRRKRGG